MERILYKHIDMSERKYMKNFGKKFAVAAISGIISLAASMTAFAASGFYGYGYYMGDYRYS